MLWTLIYQLTVYAGRKNQNHAGTLCRTTGHRDQVCAVQQQAGSGQGHAQGICRQGRSNKQEAPLRDPQGTGEQRRVLYFVSEEAVPESCEAGVLMWKCAGILSGKTDSNRRARIWPSGQSLTPGVEKPAFSPKALIERGFCFLLWAFLRNPQWVCKDSITLPCVLFSCPISVHQVRCCWSAVPLWPRPTAPAMHLSPRQPSGQPIRLYPAPPRLNRLLLECFKKDELPSEPLRWGL